MKAKTRLLPSLAISPSCKKTSGRTPTNQQQQETPTLQDDSRVNYKYNYKYNHRQRVTTEDAMVQRRNDSGDNS